MSRIRLLAVALAAVLILGFSESALGEAYVYQGQRFTYGSPFDSSPTYMSDSDMERMARNAEKDRERAASKERMRKESEERRRRARENKEPYVPPTPVEQHLHVNIPKQNVTMDQTVDSLLAAEGNRPVPTVNVPPNRKGMKIVIVGDEFYYYGDGVFYIDNGGVLSDVPAPNNAIVFKIPQDFETVDHQGKRLYKAKNTFYERVMYQGGVGYMVVDGPPGVQVEGLEKEKTPE